MSRFGTLFRQALQRVRRLSAAVLDFTQAAPNHGRFPPRRRCDTGVPVPLSTTSAGIQRRRGAKPVPSVRLREHHVGQCKSGAVAVAQGAGGQHGAVGGVGVDLAPVRSRLKPWLRGFLPALWC